MTSKGYIRRWHTPDSRDSLDTILNQNGPQELVFSARLGQTYRSDW